MIGKQNRDELIFYETRAGTDTATVKAYCFATKLEQAFDDVRLVSIERDSGIMIFGFHCRPFPE